MEGAEKNGIALRRAATISNEAELDGHKTEGDCESVPDRRPPPPTKPTCPPDKTAGHSIATDAKLQQCYQDGCTPVLPLAAPRSLTRPLNLISRPPPRPPPVLMADAGTAPNNKRCHNCRRQRLRCDRSYPHCNKCILAGKECLGYGQLFRWTGAIASRGKLAGKTSMAASDPAAEHVSQQQSDAGPSSSSAYPSPAGTPTPTSAAAQAQDRKGNKGGRQMQITTTKKAWKLAGGSSSSSSIISGNAGGAVVHAAPSTPWVLADPLVQDLSHPYRYYLSYCALLRASSPCVCQKRATNFVCLQSPNESARTW